MNTDLDMGLNMDLLSIIQKIKRESGHNPGKKQLQKLVYLIQAKGADVGYEYGIHFYGPYSKELSHDLLSLCVHGLIDFHVEGQTHEIVPSDKPAEMTVAQDDLKLIDRVIHQYQACTPSDLELITTAHFVAVNLGNSDHEILQGVERIKGDKYPQKEIRAVIQHLREEYAI